MKISRKCKLTLLLGSSILLYTFLITGNLIVPLVNNLASIVGYNNVAFINATILLLVDTLLITLLILVLRNKLWSITLSYYLLY